MHLLTYLLPFLSETTRAADMHLVSRNLEHRVWANQHVPWPSLRVPITLLRIIPGIYAKIYSRMISYTCPKTGNRVTRAAISRPNTLPESWTIITCIAVLLTFGDEFVEYNSEFK